jgi:hypothetical protein
MAMKIRMFASSLDINKGKSPRYDVSIIPIPAINPAADQSDTVVLVSFA